MEKQRRAVVNKVIALLFLMAPVLHAENIVQLFEDGSAYDAQNYDVCDMYRNGESLVIEKFIHPGDVVFDVGANVGDWSDYVRKQNRDVAIFAFEPIPHCFESFKKRHAGGSDTHVFNCAISNEIGSLPFYYYAHNTGCSGFSERKLLGKVSHVFNVPTDTIDSFCTFHEIDRINFLKIDTEGAELKVLQGALGLLKAGRIDLIQFEYGGTYPDAGITFKEVYDLLSDAHYHVFRMHPKGLIKVNGATPKRENGRYTNYFAVSNLKFLKK